MRLPFRHRTHAGEQTPAGTAPDPAPDPAPGDSAGEANQPEPARTAAQTSSTAIAEQAGHALRAPSRLHAFNRYEIKYLMPGTALPALREQLDQRFDRDSHGVCGGYGVWSVYYDSRDLRFYWEKIEGLKFRRKLRVRHYGDRFNIDDDTTVFVEIKQRVNRVTQKRRVALPYRQARQLCDSRTMVDSEPEHQAFLEEVLELTCGFDLRPVAMIGYQREAFVGRDCDTGLRVTIDQRLRGRDRDFHLAAEAENRLAIPARLAVVEFKANERVPYWLTDLAAKLNMQVARISKYCQSVEAYGRAPRSIFHVPDSDFPSDPNQDPNQDRAATAVPELALSEA